MKGLMSLTNQLLVATPLLNNLQFSHTVIYVCEHHDQGTVGLVINKPTNHAIGFVFDQLNLHPKQTERNHIPLLFGGPMQPERGFVIHRPFGVWHSSMTLVPGAVTITTSNDIIRALADDAGPQDALIVLGYVGWFGHQLEQEIMNDSWLVCPFKSELLYDVPFEDRWDATGRSIGVTMNQLTLGVGHA
jgi:putative transcriptional regulator